MAKSTSSKTKTRRPTTKRSSLSSTSKKSAAKKTVAKKETTKKPVAKSAARRKSSAQRKTVTRKPSTNKSRTTQTQLISLPLGRYGRLSLQMSRPVNAKPAKKSSNPKKKGAKKHETVKTLALLVVGLCGSLFFGIKVLAAPTAPPIVKSIPQPVVIQAPVKHFMPASTPTHLRIPDISVDTPLSTVDLAPDGSIMVPAEYSIAGWYQHSPTPGQQDPSIIVGHLDNIRGLAVFWRLRELTPGQQIQIDRADGTTMTFKVDEVAQYSPGSYPTAKIYGNLNYAGLRLITCGGTFNRLTRGYDANTVVFASQVNN